MPRLENRALTAKQERFCQAILKGLSASEAYRIVYEPTGKPATVNRAAHELTANPKIAARMAQIRAPIVESVQLSLKAHLDSLEELRDQAKTNLQFSAAISAEIARGKASGLYVIKVDATAKVEPGPNWQALIGTKSDDDD